MAPVTTQRQRCHSKKIKIPRRATEKIPENPRSNFYTIGLHFGEKSNFSWKKSNFSWKKSNFFGKKCLFSAKIKVSEDLFFLFFSRQLSFLNFYPLIEQKLRKQQLIPYFSAKTSCFSAKTT